MKQYLIVASTFTEVLVQDVLVEDAEVVIGVYEEECYEKVREKAAKEHKIDIEFLDAIEIA